MNKQIAIATALVAALAAGVVVIRQDAKDDLRSEAARNQLEAVREAEEIENETDRLSDYDLHRELCERLHADGC